MTACSKCNATDVALSSDTEVGSYKGEEYSVDIEYSQCGSCHREFLTKPQIIANEAKVRACKKKIDGLLSAEEIKTVRSFLGLSQSEASVIFGGGPNAFSKYERSEVTQSQAMDKLLRLAYSSAYIYKELVKQSGIESSTESSSSISLPMSTSRRNRQWIASEFNIAVDTHEFNGSKLKLVA